MNIDNLTIGDTKQIAAMIGGVTLQACGHPLAQGRQLLRLRRLGAQQQA